MGMCLGAVESARRLRDAVRGDFLGFRQKERQRFLGYGVLESVAPDMRFGCSESVLFLPPF